MRPTWEVIDRVAQIYSINPRLLIALVEYRSGAVTQKNISDFTYPLGYRQPTYGGLHNQLIWAAKQMSRGYYGWKSGKILEVTLSDSRVQRLDFWQNAGTAALHSLFAEMMTQEEFSRAVSPDGFSATYKKLFGDPFQHEVSLMPTNLRQPNLLLPFKKDTIWSYTGAPHAVWGDDTPWAAIDFAPPTVGIGCGFSNDWATALADGVITRSDESATVTLDLDSDGDERTGWVIFYFHLRSDEMASVGQKLKSGRSRWASFVRRRAGNGDKRPHRPQIQRRVDHCRFDYSIRDEWLENALKRQRVFWFTDLRLPRAQNRGV